MHFRTASAAGPNHCRPSTWRRQPPSFFRRFRPLRLRHLCGERRARVDGCRSTTALPRPRPCWRELASAPRALAGAPRQGRGVAMPLVTPGDRLDLRRKLGGPVPSHRRRLRQRLHVRLRRPHQPVRPRRPDLHCRTGPFGILMAPRDLKAFTGSYSSTDWPGGCSAGSYRLRSPTTCHVARRCRSHRWEGARRSDCG